MRDPPEPSGLHVFYALHHRYRTGDYDTWTYIAPVQEAARARRTFEYGTWGGKVRAEFAPRAGEIVAQEHWCSSGFANTDLDLQLEKHGIHELVTIGLLAHTCVEASVRDGAELGYHVAVVRDGRRRSDFSAPAPHHEMARSHARRTRNLTRVFSSVRRERVSRRYQRRL